jgi:hypothetical protein
VRLAKALKALYQEINNHTGPAAELATPYGTLGAGLSIFQSLYGKPRNGPETGGLMATEVNDILTEAIDRVPPPYNFDLRLNLANRNLSCAQAVKVLSPIPIPGLNYWELTFFADLVEHYRGRFLEEPQWKIWQSEVKRCKKLDPYQEGKRVAESFSKGIPQWNRLVPLTNLEGTE